MNKRYFAVSDIHNFFTELQQALKEKEFDINNSNHILIVCGDAFDRGNEAQKLLDFLTELNKQDRLIYIKGNHEWLEEDLEEQLKNREEIGLHHFSNGTVYTLCQLTNTDKYDLMLGYYDYEKIKGKLKQYHNLVKDCKNYFELRNYIFVHGWIPHIRDYSEFKNVNKEEWERVSWSNGMEEWHNGWKLKDKTIVCGHYHTSFGNYHYHNIGSGEFEQDSSFEPFIDEGIICLDGCTAFTNKVNVIIIEEENNNFKISS